MCSLRSFAAKTLAKMKSSWKLRCTERAEQRQLFPMAFSAPSANSARDKFIRKIMSARDFFSFAFPFTRGIFRWCGARAPCSLKSGLAARAKGRRGGWCRRPRPLVRRRLAVFPGFAHRNAAGTPSQGRFGHINRKIAPYRTLSHLKSCEQVGTEKAKGQRLKAELIRDKWFWGRIGCEPSERSDGRQSSLVKPPKNKKIMQSLQKRQILPVKRRANRGNSPFRDTSGRRLTNRILNARRGMRIEWPGRRSIGHGSRRRTIRETDRQCRRDPDGRKKSGQEFAFLEIPRRRS
jgi:hypothetical protein